VGLVGVLSHFNYLEDARKHKPKVDVVFIISLAAFKENA
jgi:hypothetical protein